MFSLRSSPFAPSGTQAPIHLQKPGLDSPVCLSHIGVCVTPAALQGSVTAGNSSSPVPAAQALPLAAQALITLQGNRGTALIPAQQEPQFLFCQQPTAEESLSFYKPGQFHYL